jgi:hypothetical protein
MNKSLQDESGGPWVVVRANSNETIIYEFTKNVDVLARFSVRSARTMEMIFQRTQWHVLVNQNPMSAVGAEANKADEIRVAQCAQLQDMGKELAVALL